MRLLEFLQIPELEISLDTSSYRVPLFYLGGSSHDYNNYLSTRLFESLALTEAAISRFKPIIQVFAEIDKWGTDAHIGNNHHQTASDKLDWAMRVLKREDRIIWYMRIYKALELYKLAHIDLAENPNKDAQMTFISKESNKAMGKLQKIYGTGALFVINNINRQLDIQLEHFMSMNIPKIESTVWGNQKPAELISHFHNIETEWMSRKTSVIDMDDDEGAEILIEFPDGHQWINLHRTSCSIEGDAMGHCGNTATNGATETVLSLRQPVTELGHTSKERTGNFWRPRATFILETTDGMLGEMKGRNNQKPSNKLHPYIIALLKLDLIKGITGGGYAPEENFALDDLNESDKTTLLNMKPLLGSIVDIYKMFGVTGEFKDKISAVFDAYGIFYGGVVEDDKNIIIADYDNVAAFVSDWVSDTTTETIAGIVLDGNDNLLFDGNFYSGDLSERQELANTILTDGKDNHEDLLKRLKAYVKHTYHDYFGYDEDGNDIDDDAEYDIDDIDDIVTVLYETSDDIYDEIGYAIYDGYMQGSVSSMHEAFWQWLRDPFGDNGFSMELGDNQYDSRVRIVLSISWFIKYLETYGQDAALEDIDINGWQDSADIDTITEPYYGWDSYDEDAAIESFSNDVDIPTTPSYEIEHKGVASESDVKWFKSEIKAKFDTTTQNMNNEVVLVAPDHTRFTNIDIVHGVVVMDIYPLSSGEQEDVILARYLRQITDMADERKVPVVIRNFHGNGSSDIVGETGFKKVRHGYLRYDPVITESNKVVLRGFGAKEDDGDVDGFIDEFVRITHPHPFERGARFYGDVSIILSPFSSGIHLSDIASHGDKGVGDGTRALQMLTSIADEYHVRINGFAKAYSNNSDHIQDNTVLVKWYLKHGFKITSTQDDGYDIEYTPKSITEDVFSTDFSGPFDAPKDIYPNSDPVGQTKFGWNASKDYTSNGEADLLKQQQNAGWTTNDASTPNMDRTINRDIPYKQSTPSMPVAPTTPVAPAPTTTPAPTATGPNTPNSYKFDPALDDKVKGLLQRYQTPTTEAIGDDIPVDIIPDQGVRLGRSYRLWRGTSDSSGTHGATYGLGLYTTTSRKYAKDFGNVKEVSKAESLPDNPARFRTIQDYQLWLQRFDQYNELTPRERNKKYPDVADYIRSVFPQIDGIQIGGGNDAIFVAWPVE